MLVALVSNGFTAALIVLAIVVGVQQVEGNVLQPILQGRRLDLYAAVVILAVTTGSSLYGISGAFLAVPVVAAAAAVLRYLSDLIDAEIDAQSDHNDGGNLDIPSHDGGTAATPADAPSDQQQTN